MSKTKVLVTGASGFIAKWCIGQLLEAGYEVRGTVRSIGRADEVRAAVRAQGADPGAVELVEADLLVDAGWRPAMQGCRFVLHVASPFPLKAPRDRDALIRPAREGTLRVLGHAAESGIERVVMTSSTVAIVYPSGARQSRLYDETYWTDPERADLTAYIVSKTLAERAAWRLSENLGKRTWLTAINPGLVLGPALDRDLSASHQLLRSMSAGNYPAAPAVGYPVADVRDVAAAHVRALTIEVAGGERIIAAEGYLTLMGLACLMARECPHLKWRLPWFTLHDRLVRVMSRFDRRLRPVLPDLGVVRGIRNDKAKHLLGLKFRSAEEAAVSAIRSLRQVGTIA